MKCMVILLLALVFASPCKKGPYTCSCTENMQVYGSQVCHLSEKDRDKATFQCDNYEAGLNKNGNNYNCVLN